MYRPINWLSAIFSLQEKISEWVSWPLGPTGKISWPEGRKQFDHSELFSAKEC
jgi:hypothetical protein